MDPLAYKGLESPSTDPFENEEDWYLESDTDVCDEDDYSENDFE